MMEREFGSYDLILIQGEGDFIGRLKAHMSDLLLYYA